MTSLVIGCLFKKKYITYENNKYEIFEFIEYIAEQAISKQRYNI